MPIIQSYGTNITIGVDEFIPFAINAVKVGRVSHNNPTVFNLHEAGVYRIHLDVNAPVETLGVQVMVNNVAQPQADITVSTTGTENALSLETLVEISPALNAVTSIPVQVKYTGVEGTISLANIIIEKL